MERSLDELKKNELKKKNRKQRVELMVRSCGRGCSAVVFPGGVCCLFTNSFLNWKGVNSKVTRFSHDTKVLWVLKIIKNWEELQNLSDWTEK